MKAATMNPQNGIVRYGEYRAPLVTGGDEILMQVKAAAIKQVDRSIASGKHYSNAEQVQVKAKIIGSDGAGLLADGRRVYAVGMHGMMAEQAVVNKDRMVMLPENLDYATAAALPNAVIGAAMGLRFKADIQPGDTVLINGATGFTGRVAVQIAKYYGAKKVIATGRNPKALRELLDLGADEVISIKQNDEDIVSQIQAIHHHSPVDIIIDYLWGHPAELLLRALKGNGSFTHHTRFVSVGGMAGEIISLSAATLRSVNLTLVGSGLGSLSKEHISAFFGRILPEMFQLTAEGKIRIETVSFPLSEIESVYHAAIPDGKRMVILMS